MKESVTVSWTVSYICSINRCPYIFNSNRFHVPCRFYIDGMPIREVKRTKAMHGAFPSKPMSLYTTIWDGSDWATNGGKYRVNYKYSPYIAQFTDLILRGCAVDPIEKVSSVCDDAYPASLTAEERTAMEGMRNKHMTYSYCYDRTRYHVPPSECVISPREAERLRRFDPVTFGSGGRRYRKSHHRVRGGRTDASSWWDALHRLGRGVCPGSNLSRLGEKQDAMIRPGL